MLLELVLSHRIGSASASTLEISGGRAWSGMRSVTRLTASRTSLAAASTSRVGTNSMLMSELPLRLRASIVSMPSMPARASSSTWVMRLSTTAAEAPVYSTSTETIGGSIAGSSRRVSRVKDISPSTTSSRLITTASTGTGDGDVGKFHRAACSRIGEAGFSSVSSARTFRPGAACRCHRRRCAHRP